MIETGIQRILYHGLIQKTLLLFQFHLDVTEWSLEWYPLQDVWMNYPV